MSTILARRLNIIATARLYTSYRNSLIELFEALQKNQDVHVASARAKDCASAVKAALASCSIEIDIPDIALHADTIYQFIDGNRIAFQISDALEEVHSPPDAAVFLFCFLVAGVSSTDESLLGQLTSTAYTLASTIELPEHIVDACLRSGSSAPLIKYWQSA